MATEPKTTVSIIDETLGLGNDPVDTNLNILCPIISPTGPTKLTRVTGPAMLRRYFNGGSAITPESSQTLQYARAISAQAPIYVKRASKSAIKGGKTASSLSTTFYVDELNNPLSGAVLQLTQVIPAGSEYATLLSSLQSSGSIAKIDSTTYISSKTVTNNLIKSTVTGFEPSENKYIQFIGDAALTEKVTVTVSGKEFEIAKSATDLTALFKAIAVTNKIKAIAVDGTGVYYDSTTDTFDDTGATVKFIAFDSPVLLTFASATDESKVINENSGSSMPSFYIYTIKTPEEYTGELSASSISISLAINNGTEEDVTYYIYTDDLEYNSSYGTNKIIIPSANLTFSKACKYIYDGLSGYGEIVGASAENKIIISGLKTVTNQTMPAGKSAGVTGAKVDDFIAPTSELFGVISKFPNKTNAINVDCVDNGDSTYTLTINAFGDEESFTISFVPGAIDGYGNDIYYTNVESQSRYVSVIDLGGTFSGSCNLKIGAEVKSEFIGVTELCEALEGMMETEESPVLFDYIVDGGLVDATLSKTIINACEYYKAFYPMSCQTDNMSVSNMKSNRNRIGNGQSEMRANFIAAAQRASVLDSGLVVMPASYYYLIYRIGLAKSVMEYTAVFGKNNGNIGIYNPIKDYKKSDRESMMDSQIITLKRSMTDGSWYLNLNMTCYGKDSYLQEDGIVLMNNKISQIAMTYAETLKGKYNTPELRQNVVGDLTGYIRSRLRVGTAYGPGSIRVVCDGTNNPQNIINQRKLVIDIYGRFANSVKDVLIYQHVQPLEG